MVNVRDDLTGKIFGRLRVLEQAEDKIRKDGRKRAQWLCKCSCGNNNLITVVGERLIAGKTKSCGCLQKETRIKNGKNPNSHKRTKRG